MVRIYKYAALLLLASSCAYPFEFMYDVYGTENGGLRSKRKYKEYEVLRDTLPPYIQERVAYTVNYCKNDNTDEYYPRDEESGYIVFLNGSRAIGFVAKGNTATPGDFSVAVGDIAYYKNSKNETVLYRYAAANGGQFEDWLITPRTDSTFILRTRGSGYKYFYVKSNQVPEEWLKDIEVDW